MSITPLNIGSAPNDGNGQNLRSGGQVINANFAELDTRTASAQSKADAAIPGSQKGAANGVATLGTDAKIPAGQLPALAVNEVFTVATQAAMLALTAQRGDMAIRTDQSNQAYVLAADAPTVLANWIAITQNLAAALKAIGAVAPAADTFAYFNGTTTAASTALTAVARLLLARTDVTGMRSELGLGTAAVLTATTSTSDSSVGRALKVGDFGFGSTVAPFIADMDNPVGGGYSWVTSGTANPILGFASGTQVLSFFASAAEIAQMYFSRTVPMRVGVRRMTTGTWQSPAELITSATAVTDPQTNPAGIISTSVVSGFRVDKYLSGAMCVTGKVSLASQAANSNAYQTLTLPVTFFNVANMVPGLTCNANSTSDIYGVTFQRAASTSSILYAVRNGATAQTFEVNVCVWGTWK